MSSNEATLEKALGILKLLAQGERDILEGNVLPQEDVFFLLDQELDIHEEK